ncbi:MAG TPA: hypothetical protein VFS20_03050, partial [Longimicrobium sp.]|nr:hypothetical protein [Longimicrobium sp.]
MKRIRRALPPGRVPALLAAVAALAGAAPAAEAQTPTCKRQLSALVVAMDQTIWYNRLGARDPGAMMFALYQDVRPGSAGVLAPGSVVLRPGKRPRPITLRMNVGDCLQVTLYNYLSNTPGHNQPHTRDVSIHVAGMQPVGTILADGTNVGANAGTALTPTNGRKAYNFYAAKEGTFLLYSTGAMTGGE